MSERPSPIQIDVGELVQRSVTSLYSHLVTRPTGRAVRLAIETQLAEVGETAFSLIDLSEVSVLDFSCADEVVAKLLLRYLDEDRPGDAFFALRGVRDLHREPIEVVLERRQLAVVSQSADGVFELLGSCGADESRVWEVVEKRGRLHVEEKNRVLPGESQRVALEGLIQRRLVFRAPSTGEIYALSRLVGPLSGQRDPG